MTIVTIPRALPRRSRRRERLGQVDVRGASLRADRGALLRLLPRPGRRRRERPDGDASRPSRSCTRSPAKRLAAGTAHRRRRHQRPARTRERRSFGWRASITCCRSLSCSTFPRRCRAERNAERPDRDFGPHVIRRQARPAAPIPQAPAAGGVPTRVRPPRRRGDRGRRDRRERLVDRPVESDHGPFDIIGDVHGCHDELDRAARRGSAYVADADGAHRHPDGRNARLPRRPRRPRPATRRRSCDRHGDGRPPDARSCVPGNHENKLAARAPRHATCRSPTASPSRSHSSTPSAEEFRDEVDGVHRRTRQPPRARRSASSSSRTPACARRCRAAPPGPCGRSPSTARRRARPTSSGCPSATRGPRTTAGTAMVVYGHTPVPEADVGQQHDLHRHRLRLRRLAHGARATRSGSSSRCPRRRTYYEPAKPFAAPTAAAARTTPSDPSELLDIDDVLGKRDRRRPACIGRVTIPRRTPPPRSR